MWVCDEHLKTVFDRVLEFIREDNQGGMSGSSGHWDAESRRECGPYVFEWSIREPRS